jgi:hypothetical protein
MIWWNVTQWVPAAVSVVVVLQYEQVKSLLAAACGSQAQVAQLALIVRPQLDKVVGEKLRGDPLQWVNVLACH